VCIVTITEESAAQMNIIHYVVGSHLSQLHHSTTFNYSVFVSQFYFSCWGMVLLRALLNLTLRYQTVATV